MFTSLYLTLSSTNMFLFVLTELPLPDDVNIFYAVDLHFSTPVELVVRRKSNTWHHPIRQELKPYS